MKFVKLRNGSAAIIEIKSLNDLLKIQKDTRLGFNREIVIGHNKAWWKHLDAERRKLYEQTDGWFLEVFDEWTSSRITGGNEK